MWIFYAIGSSFFAGITAILAKCGIKKADSYGMDNGVFYRKTERNPKNREKRTGFYLPVRVGNRCIVAVLLPGA